MLENFFYGDKLPEVDEIRDMARGISVTKADEEDYRPVLMAVLDVLDTLIVANNCDAEVHDRLTSDEVYERYGKIHDARVAKTYPGYESSEVCVPSILDGGNVPGFVVNVVARSEAARTVAMFKYFAEEDAKKVAEGS